MKHTREVVKRLGAISVVLVATFLSASAQRIETALPNRERIIHVQTALNHLTVIEVGEPVVTVASGSPAFKVEWRENKVFIQPTEPNVATNLFIWTASGRLNYELQPAGPVEKMDFVIDHPKPAPVAKPVVQSPSAGTQPPPEPSGPAIDAMLQARLVNNDEVRPLNDRVQVVLKDLFERNNQLSIRYAIRNRSSQDYTPGRPHLLLIQNPRSPRTLVGRSRSQLGEWEAARISAEPPAQLSVLDQRIRQTTLAPGEETVGVVVVQVPAVNSHSTLLQLRLAPEKNGEVAATMVR